KEIVKACKRATDRPVTVKMRSGIDDKHIVAKEFALAMQEAGADAITLHARTKEQGYSGKVDMQLAKEVKETLKIPLIFSGDCVDKISYENIKKMTNADGVMIGRGAVGNPEIFAEILGKNVQIDKLADIKKHIEILLKFFPERYVVLNMRSHIPHYIKGRKVDASTKLKLMKCETLDEVLKILERIFS
ncbi:MAG: tRNA-dihydrouridine synthase, partial [Clostridia bacterium]|nr:tRNA-dihydrouridine synthase [Clostridia bacterium]